MLIFADERTPFILSAKQREGVFRLCVFEIIVLSIMERSPYTRGCAWRVDRCLGPFRWRSTDVIDGMQVQ